MFFKKLNGRELDVEETIIKEQDNSARWKGRTTVIHCDEWLFV